MIRLVVLLLLGTALASCGTYQANVGKVVDMIPEWAGGLPKGVPPRPGTHLSNAAGTFNCSPIENLRRGWSEVGRPSGDERTTLAVGASGFIAVRRCIPSRSTARPLISWSPLADLGTATSATGRLSPPPWASCCAAPWRHCCGKKLLPGAS